LFNVQTGGWVLMRRILPQNHAEQKEKLTFGPDEKVLNFCFLSFVFFLTTPWLVVDSSSVNIF
jgi:hypothetical protein